MTDAASEAAVPPGGGDLDELTHLLGRLETLADDLDARLAAPPSGAVPSSAAAPPAHGTGAP